MAGTLALHTVTWVDDVWPVDAEGALDALAQCSAHGRAVPCVVRFDSEGLAVTFAEPQRRVAAGQTVALYDPQRPDSVLGSGVVR